MVAFWGLVAVVGLTLAALASTRAVDHAARAAAGFGVPAFVVGFTILALGTDLPEMANSIAASVTGHGDVNVGDSIGSAAAQATLVLGLVPLLARPVTIDRRNVGLLGSATVAVLLLGVALMVDGRLARIDGIVLVVAWGVAVWLVDREVRAPSQPELPLPERHPGAHAALATSWLLGVAGGATVAVGGLIRVAEALAVPEYVVSFLGLALGTSLPELTVAVTAARRGQSELALGDALGASLADASLSVGIGPVVAPTAVTAALVVPGGLATTAAVTLSTFVLVVRGRHTRTTGVLLVVLYVAMVPALLAEA